MKRFGVLLASLITLSVTYAHAEVGISVNIGQPGFYGQIDIGDVYPAPRVVYARPVIIHAEPDYAYAEPIYLHVPPGHAKRWSNYCGRYNACGRPVYFVNDNWYNQTYAPRYREYHERGDDGRRYEHYDHGDRRNDDRGRGDNGHDRGNGYGHGNGHGHDK